MLLYHEDIDLNVKRILKLTERPSDVDSTNLSTAIITSDPLAPVWVSCIDSPLFIGQLSLPLLTIGPDKVIMVRIAVTAGRIAVEKVNSLTPLTKAYGIPFHTVHIDPAIKSVGKDKNLLSPSPLARLQGLPHETRELPMFRIMVHDFFPTILGALGNVLPANNGGRPHGVSQGPVQAITIGRNLPDRILVVNTPLDDSPGGIFRFANGSSSIFHLQLGRNHLAEIVLKSDRPRIGCLPNPTLFIIHLLTSAARTQRTLRRGANALLTAGGHV